MPGAAAEPPALDAYYAAVHEAGELVEQNLWDRGMEKWDRALNDVAPHVSSGQLNALRWEFGSFFRSRGDKTVILGNDTDSDSSETGDDIEDSGNEGGNDSPDVDASEIMEGYQAEHKKLTKRHTMWPRRNNLRMPGRSSTISILERRATGQVPHSGFEFDDDGSHTPRGATESIAQLSKETRSREPTTSSKPMKVSEPTASPAVGESNLSGTLKGEDQVTGSNAQPHPSTALGGLMDRKEIDDWFSNLKCIAHDFVYGEKREFWPTQPVKVAILDSGFALTGEVRKAMKPYSSRIIDQKTFTHEFPDAKSPLERQQALDDPVGHGTTVAYQFMRTCPSVHVYIAKVTVAVSAHNKAVPDKGAVARAIRYAATPVAKSGWGVDIINMSFGWDESELPGTAAAVDGVSGAIEFADKAGVLLFAAASNYGLAQLNDVFYPARDPHVISVDAEDGLGNPARFALRSLRGAGGVRYCTPGLSVYSPVSAVPMCGSSFACPVAAGVAALVLEFARHEGVSLSKSPSVKRALSSARGIAKAFGPMSQQAANHPGFNMLYPWHFLRCVQREKVALDIIDQLEIEFGKGNVGYEIKWEMAWQAITQTTPTDESVVQATPASKNKVMTRLYRESVT
ncbi:peptidase S8/S53 domain-containing protein [Xylaria longipes]|nr:peptidase S8/S53 domain-containing protein [Xylaria longipes]